MHNYLVQCWIRPRSGFDITQKNKVLREFRERLREAFPGDEKVSKALDKFERNHEGMILEPFMIESDAPVKNPEKEILPEIRKDYPEAELLTCHRIPDVLGEGEFRSILDEKKDRR